MAASAGYTRNYSSDCRTDEVRSDPACVVGASASYNHGGANSVQSLTGNGFAYPCGVPLAGAARKRAVRGLLRQAQDRHTLLLLARIVQAQFLNLARQRIAPDAEQCGSFDASSVGVLQGLQDQGTLELRGERIHDAFIATL